MKGKTIVVMEVKHTGKKKKNCGAIIMEILSNPFITEDIRNNFCYL